MPLRRADQLGDDHVGPGPAEHHAQRLGDLRRGAGHQHAADDAAVAGAERVGRLDQVAPRVADGHRDHQHELEERADEDHRQLLRLADAGPQDQQRNEGRRRQVARERDERLEERLDRLVGAHRDAERQRQQRRRSRSRRARARPSCRCRWRSPCSASSVQPAAHHRQRVGEEGLARRSRRASPTAQTATKSDEEGDAEREPRARRDGRQRLHAGRRERERRSGRRGRASLDEAACRPASLRSGSCLMMPASSSRSAASLLNAACSPAKNFWLAARSCQRR